MCSAVKHTGVQGHMRTCTWGDPSSAGHRVSFKACVGMLRLKLQRYAVDTSARRPYLHMKTYVPIFQIIAQVCAHRATAAELLSHAAAASGSVSSGSGAAAAAATGRAGGSAGGAARQAGLSSSSGAAKGSGGAAGGVSAGATASPDAQVPFHVRLQALALRGILCHDVDLGKCRCSLLAQSTASEAHSPLLLYWAHGTPLLLVLILSCLQTFARFFPMRSCPQSPPWTASCWWGTLQTFRCGPVCSTGRQVECPTDCGCPNAGLTVLCSVAVCAQCYVHPKKMATLAI